MLKVHVVHEDNWGQVEVMFIDAGWLVTSDLEEADLVCFTGGADVNPHLYGEHCHKSTWPNNQRDEREMEIYHQAFELGIPMAGICRGAQFLNVMNGGRLYQDVDGHNTGVHNAWLPGNSLPVSVTSTHHQMISPNHKEDYVTLLTAQQSQTKSYMSQDTKDPYEHRVYPVKTAATDIESIYYNNSRCLCFQPHPEYSGEYAKETRELFFLFLVNYVFADEDVQIEMVM